MEVAARHPPPERRVSDVPSRPGSAATASSGEVTRFRVMAWLTGVLLLVLVLVAMPLKYLADDDRGVAVVAPLHGWLYLAYLVTAFTLAYRLRWSLGRSVLVLLAGTVPFMSFLAERRVVADLAGSRGPSQGPGEDRSQQAAVPPPPAPPA